jgi:hypothetical protein
VRDGCTCVCTSICMNVCTFFTYVILNWVCKLLICTRFSTYVYMFVRMYVYCGNVRCVRMWVHVNYVPMFTYIMYVRRYICTYVCLYVCPYVRIRLNVYKVFTCVGMVLYIAYVNYYDVCVCYVYLLLFVMSVYVR